MKITLNIDPKDIISIVPANPGRTYICMAIGNNIEVHLNAEEPADVLINRLMDEEGGAE